jgi:hypothetical protein
MATEAAWLERKESTGRKERENRKRNTLLTHTGLLMEGVSADSRSILGPNHASSPVDVGPMVCDKHFGQSIRKLVGLIEHCWNGNRACLVNESHFITDSRGSEAFAETSNKVIIFRNRAGARHIDEMCTAILTNNR